MASAHFSKFVKQRGLQYKSVNFRGENHSTLEWRRYPSDIDRALHHLECDLRCLTDYPQVDTLDSQYKFVKFGEEARKVDGRLPGKGNSNPYGASPVHLIITMIQWIRTSRLPIKNSLSGLLRRPRRALVACTYRGTSLIRKRLPLGPCSRHMPRALWRS